MNPFRRLPKPRDTARSCSPEVDLVTTIVLVATIRMNVLALDRKSAKSLHALRCELNHLGVALDRISIWLPANPDLTSRVSKLVAEASYVAQLALIDTCAAAEQHDDEARFQAGLAADAAGEAGRAATSTQKVCAS